MTILTRHQQEKRAWEEKVYTYYHELAANEANSKMAILDMVMKKYKIYGISTVYNILKRVEARKEQGI